VATVSWLTVMATWDFDVKVRAMSPILASKRGVGSEAERSPKPVGFNVKTRTANYRVNFDLMSGA